MNRVLRFGRVSLLWQPRSLFVCLGLLLAILGMSLFLLTRGSLQLSTFEVWQALLGQGDSRTLRVVNSVRLPRGLTAIGCGAALGMSGAVFQALSRNPLGSPDIIGLTTGAASGAILQIILFNAGAGQTVMAALVTGFATALVVLLLAGWRRAESGYRLILMGVGVGATLSGLNTLLMVMGNLENAMSAQIWLAGSLGARNWSHVMILTGGLCLCTPFLWVWRKEIVLLDMGDDMARALGVRVGFLRVTLVLLGVILAACATAATGPIAFVALAGPHIAQRLLRSGQISLAGSALCGALAMLLADLLTQSMPFGLSMPIGLTTGFFGGVCMLFLIARGGAKGR